MSIGDVGKLRVRADLHLVADGVDAHVVGDGSRLTMSSNDVPGLFSRAVAASSATGLGSVRQNTRRLGAQLDDAGIRLEVVGNSGTVVELGADCRSRAGQLLLGSQHVRLGPARSLAPVLAVYVRASSALRVGLAAGLLAVGVAAVVAQGRRDPH